MKNIKNTAVIIAIILLQFSITNIVAQTTIPAGDVSGIWEASNSPYQIQGDIIVQAGETLEIQAGVKVEFQGHYKLQVYGKLQALGEQDNIVHFTINDTTGFWNDENNEGAWNGIELQDNENDLTVFDFCKIEFVKGSAFSTGNYKNMVFKNNIVANNKRGDDIHYGYSINFGNYSVDNVFVLKNKIYNNYYGIYLGRINNFIFSTNTICNNSWGIISGSDIFGICSNNTICNNTSYGLNSSLSSLDFYNCIIYGNNNNGRQCYFDWGTYNFINCDIQNIIDVGDGSTPGDITVSNSIDDNPEFINPTQDGGVEYNAPEADWRLSPSSPCINVGYPDTTGLQIPITDLAGDARVYDDIIDMGAYEYTGYDDITEQKGEQISIYPIPATETIKILFKSIIAKEININVYNSSGKTVYNNTIKNIEKYNTETIKFSNFGKGIYIMNIKYGDNNLTRKIIIQ